MAGIGKQKVTDLAFFGGQPVFATPIAVGRPNIPDPDSVASDMRTILASGVLSNNGPFARRFESAIAEVAGVKHCIATCNATAALEISARALDLKGEVIVPSFTFIATAHALAWQGLTPVFVDVDPETHTLDPKCVEAAITPDTSAICGVHLWGNVCDVEALEEIAKRHQIELWYDSSHAFSVYDSRGRVGNFGRAEIFSFHATKFINAFEGGAVVTNDSKLAERIRDMSRFGVSQGEAVECLGINAKISEASAAIGLRSLENLKELKSINRRNAVLYKELLGKCPGIDYRTPKDLEGSNCQYMVCELDEKEFGISRDLLLELLTQEGILAKRYFYPGCHKAIPYRDAHAALKMQLPVTDKLTETVLVLPTGSGAAIEDIRCICNVIAFIQRFSGDIKNESNSAILGRKVM